MKTIGKKHVSESSSANLYIPSSADNFDEK